jgi:hypothetical protein
MHVPDTTHAQFFPQWQLEADNDADPPLSIDRVAERASARVAAAQVESARNATLPPLIPFYPSNRKPPCRYKVDAILTPLECFRVQGRIVGFRDPHARAATFNKMGAWLADKVHNCTRVDIFVMHFFMFASRHMPEAIASLPNPPPVVAVDQSGEIGELDAANCMFNELRKTLPDTRFILASQAASLHMSGHRCFNQHWLVPRELTRLEDAAAASRAISADTLDHSPVDLGRSRMLCLGGYPRPHKVQFMCELDASGLLHGMHWSAGTPDAWLTDNLQKTLAEHGYTSQETIEAHAFMRKLPHVLDVDRGVKKASHLSYRPALYGLARVHLVIESNDRAPSLDRHACSRTNRYTEKTFKAIYSGARFLVFGDPASLELLRSHGFRTFHPHINETYDVLPTYREKVEALKLEVARLQSMPDAKFAAFLAATQSIVEYNRQWIISKEFISRVNQQAFYAFGISETPGFASPAHEQVLDRMYKSLNITNCNSFS